MKSFLFTTFIFFAGLSLAQVGIGTTTPSASAALEVSSTNKGFLAPRVQLTGTNDVSTIAAPATGLMVYNLTAAGSGTTAVYSGFYFFDGTKWQRIISQLPDVTVEFSTTNPNSGSPSFSPNTPASSDYIYVSTIDGSQWTWNGTSYISYTPASSTPWYLGGGTNDAAGNKTGNIYRTGSLGLGATTTTDNSAQLDVNSTSKGFLPPRMTKAQRDAIVSPATGLLVFCTNCTSSGAGCLVQNVGTPAVPNWDCLGSASSPSVTAVCNGFVTGAYVKSAALNGTYTVTITNNTFNAVTLAFSITDLVLSGVSGLLVSDAAPANPTISAGGTQVITYTITGTPTVTGTLTGTWTKLTLNCSKTKNVTLGDATFPSSVTAFVFSVNDVTTTPNVISQGTLALNTTVQMPYTGGSGTYAAYTSPFVSIPAQYCEDGASDWTFGYSYSAGTFAASGNITVTLITRKAGVTTAWNAKRVASVSTINFNCVTAPWSVNGNVYTNTVGIDEGGDAIRGALSQAGCASCTAYDAAASNTLVKITLTEYNKILAVLSGAAVKGYTGNMNMSFSPNGFAIIGGTNNIAGSVSALVANSYVVAAAYQTYTNETGHIQVTGAVSPSSATTCLTSVTPSISWTSYVTQYFAVKRPTTHCGTNTCVGHIGNVQSCFPTTTGGCVYATGVLSCGASVTTAHPFAIAFQVIATPTKQW